MSNKQLKQLAESLYPKKMLKKAQKIRNRAKNSWLKPTKKYMNEPIALHKFKSDIVTMSNPTLHLTTAKDDLDDWKIQKKQEQKNLKEARKPDTHLDKSFYSPEHFKREFSYINKGINRTKAFARKLPSRDTLYYTQADALSNHIHRRILTKPFAVKTIKHSTTRFKTIRAKTRAMKNRIMKLHNHQTKPLKHLSFSNNQEFGCRINRHMFGGRTR